MEPRVLVLFAHPALESSRVNARLLAVARATAGVTVHDLYEVYPEFDVQPAWEQTLLLGHEVVVFQHPIYWYSAPALLKQWQEQVLEHGWAYGEGGDALAGKLCLPAVTTGGPAGSYRPEGSNGATLRALLAPFEGTLRLCGMRMLAPFVVHGTHRLTEERLRAAEESYRRLLEALVDGALDVDEAERCEALGPDASELDRLIGTRRGGNR